MNNLRHQAKRSPSSDGAPHKTRKLSDRWVLIGLALRLREFALIAAFHEDLLIPLPELTFFRIANHRGRPVGAERILDAMPSSAFGSTVRVIWASEWPWIFTGVHGNCSRVETGRRVSQLVWDSGPTGAVDLKHLHRWVASWFAGQPVFQQSNATLYPPATYIMLWPFFGVDVFQRGPLVLGCELHRSFGGNRLAHRVD